MTNLTPTPLFLFGMHPQPTANYIKEKNECSKFKIYYNYKIEEIKIMYLVLELKFVFNYMKLLRVSNQDQKLLEWCRDSTFIKPRDQLSWVESEK